MILKINTYENIEDGISQALGINRVCLKDIIIREYQDILKNHKFDYLNQFFNWAYKYVYDNYDNQKVQLSEIYVCHLSRMIDKTKELLPLNEFLTSKNETTLFLKSHEINFREENNKIILYYKNKKISSKKISEAREDNNYRGHLATRLGYTDGDPDFCINGFAFGAGIEKDETGYFRSLLNGPEILYDIEQCLNIDLMDDYKEQSIYYKVFLKSSFDKVVFEDDENSSWSVNEKIVYLLSSGIIHLGQYYMKEGTFYNPGVRFNDDESVKVDFYEKV